MPLVLALNINLTYLIFSCGSISFLLNKLYRYRKKGPGLICISLTSSSPISPPYPNSAEIANWPPCEDKIQLIQFVAFFKVVFFVLFWGAFFFFFGRNRKFALFRRPAPGETVDSCPETSCEILPDHEGF